MLTAKTLRSHGFLPNTEKDEWRNSLLRFFCELWLERGKPVLQILLEHEIFSSLLQRYKAQRWVTPIKTQWLQILAESIFRASLPLPTLPCAEYIVKLKKSASWARSPRFPYKNWRSRVFFLKFKLILARDLTSDTSLELAALIPNFVPLFRLLFNHKCIVFSWTSTTCR